MVTKKKKNPLETTRYTWGSATRLEKKNRDCFLYAVPSDVNLDYCLIDANTANEESIL